MITVTVQDLARLAIDLQDEDEAALQRFADIENKAFEAYMSDYNMASAICKCCHG